MLAYLRRDPLRALRLAFLLAFVLISITVVAQVKADHHSIAVTAGVMGAMLALRVAEFVRRRPLPFGVDVLELAGLAAMLADVRLTDPVLGAYFFVAMCRCTMTGPRRIGVTVVGEIAVVIGISSWLGIAMQPGTFFALPLMTGLIYGMRILLERVQAHRSKETALLSDVLTRLPFPVVVTDPDGGVLLANPAATDLVGPLDDVRAFRADGSPADLRAIRPGTQAVEMRLTRSDGTTVEVMVETVPSEAYTVIALRDITAQRRYEERLRWAAEHDALTGLPNRALLWQRLAELEGEPYAMLLVDLDGFKAVNDTFGHQAGDELLKGVTQRLLHVCPAPATVARLGGDEFAILLPHATREQARAAETAVRSCFGWEFPLLTGPVRVGGSIGSAVSEPGRSADEVLAAADEAMYGQKRSGLIRR